MTVAALAPIAATLPLAWAKPLPLAWMQILLCLAVRPLQLQPERSPLLPG